MKCDHAHLKPKAQNVLFCDLSNLFTKCEVGEHTFLFYTLEAILIMLRQCADYCDITCLTHVYFVKDLHQKDVITHTERV